MNHLPSLDSRIKAFVRLGKVMGKAADCYTETNSDFKEQYPAFLNSLQIANHFNPWFTQATLGFALKSWESVLNEESILHWINEYRPGIETMKPKKVAVIMAGNIPLVGFHDFMCTLLAGHSLIGKLSSDDKILLPAISELLYSIDSSFKQMIQFTEGTINGFDAIIATGSNNTARYFEYYFSKYPHIIRKNRNGVAVLTGKESDEAMLKFGSDMCSYFGLGCRNVSKVFLPAGFEPKKLFTSIEPYYKVLNDHFKYMNNHSYNSSVYLLNTIPHLDNGVFILTESEQYSSPISVLYYQFYHNIETLKEKLLQDDDLIQCIANDEFTGDKTVRLGSTQEPGLTDYADGVDTMKFLLNL